MAVVVDITERKQIELDLKQARQQLEEAQRVARVGSWRHHLPTDRVEWSKELFRIFGLEPTPDGLDFDTWLALIQPRRPGAFSGSLRNPAGLGKQFEYRRPAVCLWRLIARYISTSSVR